MTLEHAVFYKLENVALNGCTCLQLSKCIDFLFSLNLRMHVWNSVSRGTFNRDRESCRTLAENILKAYNSKV